MYVVFLSQLEAVVMKSRTFRCVMWTFVVTEQFLPVAIWLEVGLRSWVNVLMGALTTRRCSIVVRMLVSAGELSLFCARLLAGRVTTLWLSCPPSVSQLSHPSLRGR